MYIHALINLLLPELIFIANLLWINKQGVSQILLIGSVGLNAILALLLEPAEPGLPRGGRYSQNPNHGQILLELYILLEVSMYLRATSGHNADVVWYLI